MASVIFTEIGDCPRCGKSAVVKFWTCGCVTIQNHENQFCKPWIEGLRVECKRSRYQINQRAH